MAKKRTLLFIGTGEVGSVMLNELVRRPEIERIITADKNEMVSRARTNIAATSAIQAGFYPDIDFIPIDLFNVEDTAEKIRDIEPWMIVASPTLLSWWIFYSELPRDVAAKLDKARFGPWLPMHLTLIYKLMQAVKKSGLKVGVDTHVITTPFPDATNAVLGKIGLAPTTGIGNIAEIAPYVKMIVSKKLKTPLSNIKVFIFGHHSVDDAILVENTTRGIPYFLKVLVGDKPVLEDKKEQEEVIFATPTPIIAPGMAGHAAHPITSATAVSVIMGIWNDTGEIVHAPGPNGLPGGYPIQVRADGVEVFLPEGITMEEAIRINDEGGKADGIKEIKDDGTVVCTEEHSKVMKEALGYEPRPMKPDECTERAKEIGTLYKKLVLKYGKRSEYTHI